MLGQAQLTLRDVVHFTKKNTFDINFLEKIKVNSSSVSTTLYWCCVGRYDN